jgi:aspartate 1-decarboxylase
MQRILAKSKIHRATVTGADLEYQGSCAIDPVLLQAADILPGEQLHILNLSNGSRAVTYAIEGLTGEILLNGAMAHVGGKGDRVILLTYGNYEPAEVTGHKVRVVFVDEYNRLVGSEALEPAQIGA